MSNTKKANKTIELNLDVDGTFVHKFPGTSEEFKEQPNGTFVDKYPDAAKADSNSNAKAKSDSDSDSTTTKSTKAAPKKAPKKQTTTKTAKAETKSAPKQEAVTKETNTKTTKTETMNTTTETKETKMNGSKAQTINKSTSKSAYQEASTKAAQNDSDSRKAIDSVREEVQKRMNKKAFGYSSIFATAATALGGVAAYFHTTTVFTIDPVTNTVWMATVKGSLTAKCLIATGGLLFGIAGGYLLYCSLTESKNFFESNAATVLDKKEITGEQKEQILAQLMHEYQESKKESK